MVCLSAGQYTAHLGVVLGKHASKPFMSAESIAAHAFSHHVFHHPLSEVTQAGLELTNLLSLPPRVLWYRHVPPCPDLLYIV